MTTTFYRLSLVFVLLLSTIASIQPVSAAGSSVPESAHPNSVSAADIIRVPSEVSSLQTAINQVPDGGTIEIASGTYNSPSNGFNLSNLNKSFTIKAAPGATPILDGRGSNRVLSSYNESPQKAGFITIKGLIIEDGYVNQDGVGAVSIYASNLSFIDTVFRNNNKKSSSGQTVGAAVNIADRATVFFSNCTWENNTSENGGAGLGIRDAVVFIHNSSFIHNRTIAKSSSAVPGGGALNVANSTLRITNTRFENNEAAGHGAAIWAQGTSGQPLTTITITNSTFKNNHIVRSVSSSVPIEGGAIDAENNLHLKIFNSRFILNSAEIGGGVNIFMAKTEIYNSVFIGNQATDTDPSSGFGGAIDFNFHDRPDFASLTVENTYIQGKTAGVSTVAQFSGGINIHGIESATRPQVTVRKVILNDLDVVVTENSKSGTGGAISAMSVNLLIEDSLIMNCDAYGPNGGIGGGLVILTNTKATIRRSVFANNSAVTYGGGLFVQGAEANIDDSVFLGNEISPGVSEAEHQSYGAAIFATPNDSSGTPVNGTVQNSKFFHQKGMAIFDDDRQNGPINAVVYNNNQFFETTFGDKVYKNSTTPTYNPSGLNSLVVTHTGGLPSVDKSTTNNNTALANTPVVAKLLAAPPVLLRNAANGDADQSPPTYLGYAWSGTSATLDNVSLGNKAGVMETETSGTHTLNVNGQTQTASIAIAPMPSFALNITSGEPPVLAWSLISGSYLDMAIDNKVAYTPASSGSAKLTSANDEYIFYGITQEGGYLSIITAKPVHRFFLPFTTR